ncbi:MAG TPA: hypothetical protein VH743_17560 [Beijerinckiaceae bacterium]|jgi:hypothetical protein
MSVVMMPDYITLPPRREPHALVRTFVVLGALATLVASGIIALG